MFLTAYTFLFLSVIGLAGVSSNPPPNFGAMSLVAVAAGGGGFLACLGSSFLSFILFFVYLGGMVVVFAYSVAFAASLGQEDWKGNVSFGLFMFYLFGIFLGMFLFVEDRQDEVWVSGFEVYNDFLVQGNVVSVAFMYTNGGILLVSGGLALLVALLVVLKLVRGSSGGTIRNI